MQESPLAFEANFRCDTNARTPRDRAKPALADPYLANLLAKHGGSTFNGGIYRLFDVSDLQRWAEMAAAGFPSYAGRLVPFGTDWLGRMFALDIATLVAGQPGVIMLEPGTGEVLVTPCNAATFHESELIEFSNAALASDFYVEWRSSGGAAPSESQCVGYVKPLFFGGTDDLPNLQLTDMTIYWEISMQLISQVRNLPVGTPIGKITVAD